MSEMIVRRVKVIRSRTPQEMLNATGWRWMGYIYEVGIVEKGRAEEGVNKFIPRGDGEEVEVVFFTIDLPEFLGDRDLQREYDSRGLVPADPYTVAEVHTQEIVFSDNIPTCVYWEVDQCEYV